MQRAVDPVPWRGAQIVDPHRLTPFGAPAHHAGALVDRQVRLGRIGRDLFPPGERGESQRAGALVEQTEGAVRGAGQFDRRAQDSAQRFFQAAARGDQLFRVVQPFQFVHLALQRAVDPFEAPRIVKRHRRLVGQEVQAQEFLRREPPFGFQQEVQRAGRFFPGQQRVARHGAESRLELVLLHRERRLFIRKHPLLMPERPRAYSVGAGEIIHHVFPALAGAGPRGGIERRPFRVVGVYHGRRVVPVIPVDQAHGRIRDQPQRIGGRVLGRKAVDLGGQFPEDGQRRQEVSIGIGIFSAHNDFQVIIRSSGKRGGL